MSRQTHHPHVPLERWLDALADIGEAVGGDEPVTDLLDRVARTACTLFGYDFCAVFLPDHSGAALTIVGSHGLSADYVAQVNADRPILLDVHSAEEAPTSVAFRTGDVVALEDIERVPGIGPWGGVAHEQGYRALVSVPLRRSGRVVGALNGYHAAPHRFDHAEISLVNAMATQAAVALGTAQLRAGEQDAIRELRRAEEVHALLTATALRGEGVAGVAAALAELLGAPVRPR
ncbi:GAF domain-containing protein [Arthrobacter sp. Y81]|uniref:GAF domain-containing protein n=1 Tax=Arthrobacter sp. Y81 TaxID=2058897 RepID=UPI0015E4178B|nr:GAF domain-containing protein [Arthrobacter sp. Y81]